MAQQEELNTKGQESLFQKVRIMVRADFRKNQRFYTILAGISIFLGLYFSSNLMQSIYLATGRIQRRTGNPFIAVAYVFSSLFGILSFLCMTAGIIFAVLIIKVLMKKPYKYDPRRKVYVADSGEGGTAGFMSPEEEERNFYRGRNIETFKHAVLGIDDEGYLCARKPIRYSNANTAIVGYPGCGKSACIVLPHIFQCIRRGESFIVTDSKGSIYEESVYLARKSGYTVKVINLKPDELRNSDGIQLMKTIKNEMGAETMANIIINNSKPPGAKKDFWDDAAFNLLKALILYVKFSNAYPREKKTLITVYDILVRNDADSLVSIFSSLREDSPAFASANTFCLSTDTVKQSAHAGLLIKLSLLSQPAIQQVLTHDEVDFRLPLSEKCAYYVIIPDVENPAKFLSCLFFSTLINELLQESDSRYHQNPPVIVQLILDEFFATGSINNFAQTLSVSRSRKVNIEFILQDITQLQAMYPDNWRTIMNCCTTWILLAAREEASLEYFSSISGDQTIYSEQVAHTEAKLDPLKIHPVDNVRGSLQSRQLLTIGDTYKIGDEELLVSLAGKDVIILKKYNYWEHPFYKVIYPHGIDKNHNPIAPHHKEKPGDYIPEWRRELIARGEDIEEYDPDEETQAPKPAGSENGGTGTDDSDGNRQDKRTPSRPARGSYRTRGIKEATGNVPGRARK